MSEVRQESRVVVGVDGSPQSKSALEWAARIAGMANGRVEAVIAWDYPVNFGFAAAPEAWQPDADAAKLLEETIDAVFGENRPANIEARVLRGYPSRVLLEASQGAAMLVVGSRGHGGFTGLLLGSVSRACAEHAKCPVLIVH